LDSVANTIGAKISRSSSSATISKAGISAEFSPNNQYFLYNDCKIFIGKPIILQQKTLYVAMDDYKLYVHRCFSQQLSPLSYPI
jgi:hypothetical protein